MEVVTFLYQFAGNPKLFYHLAYQVKSQPREPVQICVSIQTLVFGVGAK